MMGAIERILLVVCLVFFFLWFSLPRNREGFAPAPYMDSWNWDIKGLKTNKNTLQTSGMDVLFPVYEYVPTPVYTTSFEPVSSWYYDSVTYGPISSPWGPSSRDVLVRF
jgi:hypothetical protein